MNSGAGQKNLCWSKGQQCIPSFCRQGVLGRASSQACPRGCTSRTTKFLCNDNDVHQPAWLEYPFCRVHLILRWLPTKLATWIGENFGQELCIPPKQGLKWTVGELNAVLENNLVPSHNSRGQLRTVCCIQWECELYSGRPKARCYPFNLSGHRFRGKNCQVFHII